MAFKKDTTITLGLFIVLTTIFYVIGYWLIFRLGKATPLMLSVGVAAITTCWIRKIPIASLGWSWGPWKYQYQSYFIPLLAIGFGYILIWSLGFGEWYNTDFIAEQKEAYNLTNWNDYGIIFFHFAITATITFLLALPSVLGEEVAWRGFLIPELMKSMTFKGTALVSGFLWSIWHWPLMYVGIYGNSHTPLYFQLFCFTLYIMSSSVIMTYLRLKSNSLWTAVIFHMSGNVFLQKYFSSLTINTQDTYWYGDEFGLMPPLMLFLISIHFWRKGVKEFS
ncbi:CPBP family intramembrane glutamic endopeptidase [Pseudemcibacter aquimaris]|uniref:CPBP family intramembrane glutamic endopeptidase n=1 Tax=Pseudemcibacter aquimaris TaxID=2857064 RepID=UPI0020122C76|nr:CPBP family intramembrane glutamic endopeptidase [Pseudemcibacter aquimaris]MCC3860080.1 CPBP family intramembrane metalloprotease [Pseudemcibacter aquimaris]WDU57409.1 CPBP family intramembrane metalloprotease [Pseudemcibacter aquimaris]